MNHWISLSCTNPAQFWDVLAGSGHPEQVGKWFMQQIRLSGDFLIPGVCGLDSINLFWQNPLSISGPMSHCLTLHLDYKLLETGTVSSFMFCTEMNTLEVVNNNNNNTTQMRKFFELCFVHGSRCCVGIRTVLPVTGSILGIY